MSGLKIGLVASDGDESEQMVHLLEANNAEVVHKILPEQINEQLVEDSSLHVWLLNVDDDSWHDAIDHLLDASEVPVYFNEPGTLAKQAHPQYWCSNLLNRLYEISGLDSQADKAVNQEVEDSPSESLATEEAIESMPVLEESQTPLSQSLEALEGSTVDLPKDIAAELVSELESLSPVLKEELPPLPKPTLPQLLDDNETQLDEAQLDEAELDEVELGEVENDIDVSMAGESQLVELDLEDLVLLESYTNESYSRELEVDDIESSDLESQEFEVGELDFEVIDPSEKPQKESSALLSIEPLDLLDKETPELNEETLTAEVSREQSVDDDFLVDLSPDSEFNLELDWGDEQEDISDELEAIDNSFAQDSANEKVEPSIDESNFSELTLESLEEEVLPITGIAEYQIDAGELPEEKAQETQAAPEFVDEFDGLSLETFEHEKKLTGRAEFQLDDEPEEELVELSNAEIDAENQQKTATLAEPLQAETQAQASLTLESIESQQTSDWLTTEALDAESETVDNIDDTVSQETSSIDEESLAENEFDLSLELLEEENDVTAAAELLETESFEQKDFKNEQHDETSFELESIDLPDSDSADSDNKPLLESELLDSELTDAIELDEEAVKELANSALQEPIEVEISESSFGIDEPQNLITPEAHKEPLEFDIPMLDETAFDVEFEEKIQPISAPKSLTPCWVIGASLGGPAAVKRFLDGIPADINASFVIAQHIDENFLPVLAEILTNSSGFTVKVAQGSNEMQAGQVYLAPLKGKLVFLQDGSMLVDRSQKWSGPYSPCIDDVIDSVSQVYGAQSGAIIFSGMGEDGLNGVRKMRQEGGQVWAQSADTCANASMPEAIINNGETDFIGTPEELASRLVQQLKTNQSLAG